MGGRLIGGGGGVGGGGGEARAWGRPADPSRPAVLPPLAALPPLKAPAKPPAAQPEKDAEAVEELQGHRQESGKQPSGKRAVADAVASGKRPSAVAMMVNDYWKKEEEAASKKKEFQKACGCNAARRGRLPPLQEEDLNQTVKSDADNPGCVVTTPQASEEEPVALDWRCLDAVALGAQK